VKFFKLLILAFLLITAAFNTTLSSQNHILQLKSSQLNSQVFICKSPNAYAYHKHKCHGLKRCKYKVEKVDEAKAKKLGRKKCGYCY